MLAKTAIDQFKRSADLAAPEVQQALALASVRQQLYKLLLEEELSTFCEMIRAAFAKEIELRNSLWEGQAKDEEEFYEGIYRCGFLIYKLADPNDLWRLWHAKHINMDVGSSMGAEFFIGAGLNEVASFLENDARPESAEISAYVKDWFSQDDALHWQEDWEQDMQTNIEGA